MGKLRCPASLTGLLLRSCDHLGSLMDVLEAGAPEPAPEVKATGDALQAERLYQWAGTGNRQGGRSRIRSPVLWWWCGQHG